MVRIGDDGPVRNDPRFLAAIELFNAGDWLEASEAFEELFFEAVRGEIEIVRVLMQFSTGLHHTSRGHSRPAVERIEAGLEAAEAVTERHGIDLARLCADMREAVDDIRGRRRAPRVTVYLRED